MREYSQQPVNGEMQNYVSNNRNHDREQQSMSLVGAGTRYYASEWLVKRVGDGDDKLNESGAAAGRQQCQQKSHSEQCVEYIEDVVNHLGNTRHTTGAFYLALGTDNLIDCFGPKLAGHMLDFSALTRSRLLTCAVGYFGVHLAFYLRFYAFVLD